MGEVFNLHQYSHCVSFILRNKIINSVFTPNATRLPQFVSFQELKDSFLCNTQTNQFVYWGSQSPADYLDREQMLKSEDFQGKGWIHISDFVDGLYQAFKKGKKNWDNSDILFQQAVSNFIRLITKNALDQHNGEVIGKLDAVHYVCVTPSEWNYKMREEVLRPIFIKSGLISENDHKDRLLFLTATEAIFYHFQRHCPVRFGILMDYARYFKIGEHRIMCNLNPLDNNTVSVELKLIETQRYPFDIPNPLLYPRVRNSTAHLFEDKSVKKNLTHLLKHKLFPNEANYEEDELIQMLVEDIYNSIGSKMKIFNRERDISIFKSPWNTGEEVCLLDESQSNYLNSLCIFDICQECNKDILQAMIKLLANRNKKDCSFYLVLDNYVNEESPDFTRTAWIQAILESCKYVLAETITQTDRVEYPSHNFKHYLIEGANIFAIDAIRNSDVHSPPCLTSQENKADFSSAIFLDSGPNAILNIDISLSSTLISYTLVDENGTIEKVLDNSFFISHKSIIPLEHFFRISDVTTLNVNKQFIRLAEKYLKDPLNWQPEDQLIQFSGILNNHPNEIRVSIQQTKYIKLFILMYIAYLKEIIACKLPKKNMDLKIGYSIRIENILLNRIVGTKEDLKDLVYQSGLLQMNDDSKKLRISTQGQGLLPLFQKEWQLNIPIKSYFVLAQLHEDYVQLTLNQVVTELDSKKGGEQESIILQEEIIPIENVYDSLCTHMWSNILNNTSIIQLCDVHCEYNDFMLFELFSCKTRIEFMGYLKQLISNKILSVNNHLHFDDTQWVPLSSTCKCGIYLSVRDIIDISFQPVFQEIAFLVTTSLIDTNLFGNYTNIEFIFYVICFNNNSKFQAILADILNDEQDSEVRSLILPKLYNQLLQSIAHQRSSAAYKSFQDGELHQISNENYGFYLYCLKGYQSKNIPPFYKDKINDEESQDSQDVIFLLLEKGTIISRCGVKRVIYLKITENIKDKFLKIYIGKFLNLEGLHPNKTLHSRSDSWEAVCSLDIDLSSRNFLVDSYVPIMVSIQPKFHTCSLKFSARIVGQEDVPDVFSSYVKLGDYQEVITDERGKEVGVPLYLARF